MGQCEIGVYGLGVMGASIAQNMLNHGFHTAVFSVSEKERAQFHVSEYAEICEMCGDEAAFLGALAAPRKIFLMITAGAPVDAVLDHLLPMLEAGDIIYDGGNSYYKDTDRRCERCGKLGIHYVGTGVSGGQLGALYGPSIMPGGSREGYLAGEQILTGIAAHVNGQPCCSYIGQGGSGHYVKMVHNGIEYAILQLIGEAYMLLRHGLGMEHTEVLQIFRKWKTGRLDSYLIDISIQVMEQYEEDGSPLIDKILDVAEQKGTGKWTVMESVERGVYVPGIYEALMARNFSAQKSLRTKGAAILPVTGQTMRMSDPEEELGNALLLAIALAYSQGMELIRKASEDNRWDINMAALADVWRDGCIIRSRLLDDIKAAAKELSSAPAGQNGDEAAPMLLTEAFVQLRQAEPYLRRTVVQAETAGIASPGFAAALHYYDYYHIEDMPVRFVQALRDCFGAHTYMRADKPGHFHTDWQK